jgi:hypothetical protein
MRRFSKAEKKLSMSMRTKEKHLKCLQKLTKANVRKNHINVKVLGVKFLAWEKLKV